MDFMLAFNNEAFEVVESVPVPEDIKLGNEKAPQLIENYCENIRRLGEAGVKCVCYNFMPILDWTRSNLSLMLPDGSDVLCYDHCEVAAFDMFSLQRPNAKRDYDEETVDRAKILWEKCSPSMRSRIEKSILLGLPGTVDDLTPSQFLEQLDTYKDIGEAALRSHMYGFLNEITPVLEETGVRMAIHPDDPPHPIFGLPCILSNATALTFVRFC